MIKLDVRIVPRGSATITEPIELSLGGPFTSTSKLPDSDFTITAQAQGQRGSLQLISADGKGYITVSGQSYAMPAANLKSLVSGFGSLTGASGSGSGSSTGSGSGSSTGSGSGSGASGKHGSQSLSWLTDARTVGSSTVDGTATTQVRASVDSMAMVRKVSKLFGSVGSLGGAGHAGTMTKGIPASIQQQIAKALGTPTVNVWIGKSDKMVRKLTVKTTIPVTGQTGTALGGMTSATVTLDFEYTGINQPQTITAPTSVQPFSVFRTKVDDLLQQIEGGLVAGSLNGDRGFSGSIQPGTSTVVTADSKYTNCITKANGDVKQMQKCSKLLGSG